MEATWMKPIDYFKGTPDVIFFEENPVYAVGKVVLLAVNKGDVVASLRLKKMKNDI